MHGGHHHEQHHHKHHHVPRHPGVQGPPRLHRVGWAPVNRATFFVVILPIAIIVFVIGMGANFAG